MNMNQLKYVLTVANSSSLREAAMKLYISQPALSLSISELENELGIVLCRYGKPLLVLITRHG